MDKIYIMNGDLQPLNMLVELHQNHGTAKSNIMIMILFRVILKDKLLAILLHWFGKHQQKLDLVSVLALNPKKVVVKFGKDSVFMLSLTIYKLEMLRDNS